VTPHRARGSTRPAAATPGAAPPRGSNGQGRSPHVVIRPGKALFRLELFTLWEYREVLYFLVWRDLKIRYKQTVIGAAWAVLQPMLTMAIATIIFGHVARVPSNGLPYPVFVYTALLPWMYFAQALAYTTASLVNDQTLLTKIYFPRLFIPLAAAVRPGVDAGFAFLVLVPLLVWLRIPPTPRVLALPLFAFLAVVSALAVGLWLSALNVRYRDVAYTIPFVTQIWMFLSPVVYPASLIPRRWRVLYGLNPLTGVIEGFRWSLLGNPTPDFALIVVSSLMVLALLAGGLVFFQQMERTFADMV
jgi:lipopolysaccharide transport system permease protein